MPTTTHRIALTADAYTNVSGGQPDCSISKGDQPVRLVVGATEPDADTPDYVAVDEPRRITAEGLAAEDAVWLRAEHDASEITVLRGPARIALRPG